MERAAIRFHAVLNESYGVEIGQKFTRPAVHDTAAALQRAFDVSLIVARQNEYGIATGQGLISSIQRTAVGELHRLAIRVFAIEREHQSCRMGFNNVSRPPPSLPVVVVQRFGIEFPRANERIGVETNRILRPNKKVYESGRSLAKADGLRHGVPL